MVIVSAVLPILLSSCFLAALSLVNLLLMRIAGSAGLPTQAKQAADQLHSSHKACSQDRSCTAATVKLEHQQERQVLTALWLPSIPQQPLLRIASVGTNFVFLFYFTNLHRLLFQYVIF
jgi:hypothetical protein